MDIWEGDDDDITFAEIPEYNLDLSALQPCKIKMINRFINKSVLCLESTKNGEQAICNVEGFWLNINLEIGDTVNATASKIDNEWFINNDQGLLVYEPDLLISTTSVVGSLWCKRRTMLTDLFRGFEPATEAMVVGTCVHVILQTCLRKNIIHIEDISNILDKELATPNNVRRLYESGISKEHLRERISQFLPNIQYFLHHYVQKQTTEKAEQKQDNWQGVIQSIEDIEENIWCPELGLKGKVDVSIKTAFNVLPLEIKTGRASFSLEHKGQVMMYVMMMQKMGYKVSTGLLLYLRENILREVQTTKKEMRDLLILRNDLCYSLTRKLKIGDENSLSLKMYPPELPPPINHPSCQKCPYKYICSSYAKYFQEDISSNKVLKETVDEISQQISEAHLNYVMSWITLLDLECSSDRCSKELREIYTQTAEQREAKGRCIRNLKVLSVGDDVNGVYEHIFENLNYSNLFSNGITEGNYVLISTDKRTAIASGFVNCLTTKTISVFLERNLNAKHANQAFHIDSYDSSSTKSFNLNSLSLLLEVTPKAEKLRKLIIDKAQPVFKTTLPKVIAKLGRSILKKLNVCQQRAVLKALTAQDYFLIKGMPGTGKTLTLAALIQLLHALDRSVLITSHTHSAVDNVCLKLVDSGVKFMRLGSMSRIHPQLKEYSEHNLTRHCQTPDELEKVYNSMQIFAVTCLGSGHPVLSKRSLDVCIIDESTQVMQSSVIRPIHTANTFILIGDPEQLPTVVKNKQARELGMSESIFERLYREENSSVMNINYRMNKEITALANEITYNGELLIGSDDVSKATIKIPNKQILESLSPGFHWIKEALTDSMENSVMFIDTGPTFNLNHDVSWRIKQKSISTEDTENQNCLNVYEAAIVFKLVSTLLQAGVKPDTIGVIAAFRIQVAQLSSVIHSDVNVNTVDQFQGKDKNIVIVSYSKSRDVSIERNISKHEILEDKRRLTVAITRAKHKLIIIGDVATISQYSTFKKMIPYLKKNTIRLNNYRDFNWDFIESVI